MKDSMIAIINAKAAAHQEADELAAAATRQHRMDQIAARARMYNRAMNTALRQYTQLLVLDGLCIGVTITSLLVIALCAIF